jgi:hypothetical protein
METPTRRFRRQHAELQVLAKELIKRALVPSANAPELRRLLAQFAGKLRVHAAMETEALYPALLGSTDPETRTRTERLHAELGALYGTFDDFEARWPDAGAIGEHLIRFRIDLVRVMAILGRRMVKENRELYPMADAALE